MAGFGSLDEKLSAEAGHADPAKHERDQGAGPVTITATRHRLNGAQNSHDKERDGSPEARPLFCESPRIMGSSVGLLFRLQFLDRGGQAFRCVAVPSIINMGSISR